MADLRMAVLLTAVALFVLTFLAQIALKHVWFPRRRTQGLLILYFIVPLFAIAAGGVIGHPLAFSAPDSVRIALFYASYSLAYIALYSAIEMESPTLAIVSNVAKAGPAGRTESELYDRFARDFAMSGRFALMETGGLVLVDGEVVRLTPQGRFYAELFERASRIFGLTKGG